MEADTLEFILWRGEKHDLLPGMFYHLAGQDSLVFWNAFLNRGFITSISVAAQADGLEDATTPYQFTRQQDSKDQLWERIRESEFPHKPSRMKALFLFDDRDTALHAKESMVLW